MIFENKTFDSFISKIYKHALLVGVLLGIIIIVFAKQLQALFNTSSSAMFVVFGLGVPLYFLMSVNRGVFQGRKSLKNLSITYQGEMLSRLIITLGLIFLFNIHSSIVIAIGIIISFVFGLFPFKLKYFRLKTKAAIDADKRKAIRNFFVITASVSYTHLTLPTKA